MANAAQAIPPEIRSKFTQMREDIKKITNTLQDVESQHSEYSVALVAIEKLPAERKCFRMVGHALVEHTVGEVTPVIKERRDQLANLAKGLGEQLEKLEETATKFALDNGLATRTEQPGQDKAPKTESKGPTGVLV